MAARFWVGGTGTWNNSSTTNWSATTGGAGGASAPTNADTVTFDANSGTAATVTVASTAVSLSTTVNKADINLSLSGSPTLCTAAGTLTLTLGTITLNNFTISTGIFSSDNANTRTIAFGSGNIALTSTTAATVVLAMATATGFTWTGTGGFTRNMAATATMTLGSTAGGSSTSAVNIIVNAGASTLTLTASSHFNSLNFTGSTCSVNNQVNVYGDVIFASGGTYTGFSPVFKATTTFSSLGKQINSMIVSGTGITVTLGDALTVSPSFFTTLTEGTLDLNGFSLSTGTFTSSGTLTRSLVLGSQNITLTSVTAAATVLSMATVTNFTWTGTGGFIRNQAATATIDFSGTTGGTSANAPNVTVNAGSSALTIALGSVYKALTFTGSSCPVSGLNITVYGNLTLATLGTYTGFGPILATTQTFSSLTKTLGGFGVNGSAITITLGDALTVDLTGTTTLTQGTIDLNGFALSTGIFSSSNTNTRSIAFGSQNIALTSTTAATTVLSMATATNFTWTGTGGFTRNMLATATVNFGATAGGSTTNAPNLTVTNTAALTITNGSYFKTMDFTGASLTATGSYNACDSLTLGSLGTYTALAPTFLASGTITSAGRSLASTTVNGSGITVTLADALTLGSANSLTLTQGTFNAANFNVTTGLFNSNNSNTRALDMGSGTWTISSTSALAWNITTSTGMTLSPSTSTINMSAAGAKTFTGGGLTYYNLNQSGLGRLTINGSNTFNNITNTVQPTIIQFQINNTQTVSNFGVSGTAGNIVTLQSASSGAKTTLSKSFGTVTVQYVSLEDINVTGGAVWDATSRTNSFIGYDNIGWSTAGGGAFVLF